MTKFVIIQILILCLHFIRVSVTPRVYFPNNWAGVKVVFKWYFDPNYCTAGSVMSHMNKTDVTRCMGQFMRNYSDSHDPKTPRLTEIIFPFPWKETWAATIQHTNLQFIWGQDELPRSKYVSILSLDFPVHISLCSNHTSISHKGWVMHRYDKQKSSLIKWQAAKRITQFIFSSHPRTGYSGFAPWLPPALHSPEIARLIFHKKQGCLLKSTDRVHLNFLSVCDGLWLIVMCG